MIVRPMLGDWELPSIISIDSRERRRVSVMGVPGLIGDLQQDLGHGSLEVEIVGSLAGDEARDGFLESLRAPFRAGDPVTFVADIATATDLDRVLIVALDVQERNDHADHVRYRVVLRQYVEPPEPPAPFDDLGADLGLDALADLGLDGLELPDLLGQVPEVGDPVKPVQPALEAVRAAVAPLKDLVGDLEKVFTT